MAVITDVIDIVITAISLSKGKKHKLSKNLQKASDQLERQMKGIE